MTDITPDLHSHLESCGTTCGKLVREWLSSGYASALDTKALRLLWEKAFHQDQGRIALVAAAVALLKWAEEELLSEPTSEGIREALSHAASNCLESEDFATAVEIWMEAIPIEEHNELRKEARADIAARKPQTPKLAPVAPPSVADKLKAAAAATTVEPLEAVKPMMTVAQHGRATAVASRKEGGAVHNRIGAWEARLEDYAPAATTA